MNTLSRLVLIGGIVVAGAACSNDDLGTAKAAVVTVRQPEYQAEVAAIDFAWDDSGYQICAILRQNGGLTPELEDFAVIEFEKGYGETLTIKGEQRLRWHLRSC